MDRGFQGLPLGREEWCEELIGRMQLVTRRNDLTSFHVPTSDLSPSGVILWLRVVKLLYSCRTPAIDIGYVRSLLKCRRALSVSIEGNPLVYQKMSQFASETVSPYGMGPEDSMLVGKVRGMSTHRAWQIPQSCVHFAGRGHPR